MNARDLVTSRIAMQARRFPDLEIAPLNTAGLDDRDSSLAHAIDHSVISRWLTLQCVLESQLTRPWAEVENRLQAALLVGAAQLLLLDRLPDHAVINQAVEWAKRTIRPKAGGMVNAVLRKVANLRLGQEKRCQEPFSRDDLPLEDGRIRRLNGAVFDSSPLRRLGQQTSHPEQLINHWLGIFGEQATAAIAIHNLVHPPIAVNLGHSRTIEQTIDTSTTTGGRDEGQHATANLQPHHIPGFAIFNGDRRALQGFLVANPAAIVQDPTAAAPALATKHLQPPPKLIMDLCAGQGTKTRQLVQLHPGARIVASDIDAGRMAKLQLVFRDQAQVEVVSYHDLRRFDGQADLILLDVPCTNTGVLARRVEARYRFNPATLQQLIDVQRQIMADSIPLLSERGRIVYSTCSIEPGENQQQAQWLTSWHRLGIATERSGLPQGLPGEDPAGYCDGGYFAVLDRG